MRHIIILLILPSSGQELYVGWAIYLILFIFLMKNAVTYSIRSRLYKSNQFVQTSIQIQT